MEIRTAIITVSDRSASGERPDTSGPALKKAILEQGWQVVKREILPDDLVKLRDHLVALAESGKVDIILTTGGTGFGPRDITPEATLGVIERLAPGLAEAMRAYSLQITPHAMLSRAIAGIRGRTLIVNLPGSPKGAIENLQVILPAIPHAVELMLSSPLAEAGHQGTGGIS